MFEKFEDVFTVPYFVDNPVLEKKLDFRHDQCKQFLIILELKTHL